VVADQVLQHVYGVQIVAEDQHLFTWRDWDHLNLGSILRSFRGFTTTLLVMCRMLGISFIFTRFLKIRWVNPSSICVQSYPHICCSSITNYVYIYIHIYIYTQISIRSSSVDNVFLMYNVLCGGVLKWRYPWIPPNHPSHFIIIVLKLMVLVIPILGNTHIYI